MRGSSSGKYQRASWRILLRHFPDPARLPRAACRSPRFTYNFIRAKFCRARVSVGGIAVFGRNNIVFTRVYAASAFLYIPE